MILTEDYVNEQIEETRHAIETYGNLPQSRRNDEYGGMDPSPVQLKHIDEYLGHAPRSVEEFLSAWEAIGCVSEGD
jgi:hypothetical protein